MCEQISDYEREVVLAPFAQDLKKLVKLIREINQLEQDINQTYGVKLITGYIPSYVEDDARGDVTVRRGIEVIEAALCKKAKTEVGFTNLKSLRHMGVVFRQYADDRTKTFVKAFCKPPKVVIVNDDVEEAET